MPKVFIKDFGKNPKIENVNWTEHRVVWNRAKFNATCFL